MNGTSNPQQQLVYVKPQLQVFRLRDLPPALAASSCQSPGNSHDNDGCGNLESGDISIGLLKNHLKG